MEHWTDYLPLMGMILFYLTFPIGFSSVIFVLLGEIFSPSIKGVATSVSTVVLWTSEFVTAKVFFIHNDTIGIDGTFYLFAAVSFAAAVFVLVFIRETKNKTLAEIQEIYSDDRSCFSFK